MTTVEPEWDDEQQGWMLALAMLRDWRCGGCGGDLHETTDPANDANNPRGQRIYRPLLPIECHRCSALRRAAKPYDKDERALIHRVELRPRGR